MNPYAKTGDLRNPTALANLNEVRLFMEVEAAQLSGDQSKANEDDIARQVTAALNGNGIAVGVNPATPGLFVTVIGYEVKGLAIVRVDLSLRETLNIPRAATSLTCTVWSVRTDILIYQTPKVLSVKDIATLNEQVKTWITGQLSGFFRDRSHSADNKVGDRIIADYMNAAVHNPGGDAAQVAYDRVSAGFNAACGGPLPALGGGTAFELLWRSNVNPNPAWLAIPVEFRGKGPVGALGQLGKGTMLDKVAIFEGGLNQGAVLQTWQKAADYDRVVAGNSPLGLGHTFIFLRYHTVGSKIVGMKIADQGLQSAAVVKLSDYEAWFGLNVQC